MRVAPKWLLQFVFSCYTATQEKLEKLEKERLERKRKRKERIARGMTGKVDDNEEDLMDLLDKEDGYELIDQGAVRGSSADQGGTIITQPQPEEPINAPSSSPML